MRHKTPSSPHTSTCTGFAARAPSGRGCCRSRGTKRSAGDAASPRSGTPEQLADDRDLRRQIHGAIDALTPKLRDTLLLAQSGDYSYEEIGAIVGAPVGTIKWRVSEARRIVRRQLREQGYADVG